VWEIFTTSLTIGQSTIGNLEFATSDEKKIREDCAYTYVEKNFPGLWYKFQGNGGAVSVQSRCPGFGIGTHISVYNGTCGAATLQCVAGFDYPCRSAPSVSPPNFTTSAGTTYYVLVVYSGLETYGSQFNLLIASGAPTPPSSIVPRSSPIVAPVAPIPLTVPTPPRASSPVVPVIAPPTIQSPMETTPVAVPPTTTTRPQSPVAVPAAAPAPQRAAPTVNRPRCRVFCRFGRLFRSVWGIFHP
jgi:hypothetical protein